MRKFIWILCSFFGIIFLGDARIVYASHFDNWELPIINNISKINYFIFTDKGDDFLQLKWTEINTINGYILEQYENGNWERIARIDDKNITNYRVEGLHSGTEYKFRIKTFVYDGEQPIYSEYTEVAGTTLMPDCYNTKIVGKSNDALRVGWGKLNSVDGYILEQYKEGNWVRIARIGDKNTETYRVEGLRSGTEYKFRIKTFVYDGVQSNYGEYTEIIGTTLMPECYNVEIVGKSNDALRISWGKLNSIDGYILEQYKEGNWVRIARIGDKNTTTYRVEGLHSGTEYKLRIKTFVYDGVQSNYSEYVEIMGTTLMPECYNVEIVGKSNDALRISWGKLNSIDGYILEQYKKGNWVRIARIGDRNTATYRVEGLHSGTEYKFRIKTFVYDGVRSNYSDYAEIIGTTLMPECYNVEIVGKSNDALRISWGKLNSIDGYILEQYKEGNWVRIARIGDKNTTTYRVEELRSKTEYKFRIKTFVYDGIQSNYSEYTEIAGKTL